ncbi:MAG: hypothetical protein H7287_04960, partial [Thermoleophilia bacterium]|nr:hypothetical protein [Thermoleophilia bacterium]
GPPAAPTLRYTGAGLQYRADDAINHEVEAFVTGRTLTLIDHSVTAFDRALPSGCTQLTPAVGTGADCVLPDDATLRIKLGAGDDYVAASDLPASVDLNVDTGDGTNAVEGGSGDDYIVGGSAGDTLFGGPGADIIRAGNGFNFVHGNSGADVITTGADIDFIFGDASDDVITSGGSFDFIYGGGGNDIIYGGADSDYLSGGSGNDYILGAGGDDEINGGSGTDNVDGGGGADLIRVRDGASDSIQCGAGNDVARVDAGEVDRAKRSCETVVQYDSTVVDPEDQFDVEDESFEEAVNAVDQGEANAGHGYRNHGAQWFRSHHGH